MEFVAQQPSQIMRRSLRLVELKSEPVTENSKCLTNGILQECINGEFSPFFVPTSIEQARNTPKAKLWEDEIQTEIDSVYLNNTFSKPNQTKCTILQMRTDAATAFLYIWRTLQEIYVMLSDEFTSTVDIEQGLIHKLLKSLCGTSDAPHIHGVYIQFYQHNYLLIKD